MFMIIHNLSDQWRIWDFSKEGATRRRRRGGGAWWRWLGPLPRKKIFLFPKW